MITPFVLLHFYPPSHDKTSPALSLTVSMPEALHRTHKETSHLGTLKNCDHFVSIVVRRVFSFFIQNCFWFCFRSYQFLLLVFLCDSPVINRQYQSEAEWNHISVFVELVSEKVPPFCAITSGTKTAFELFPEGQKKSFLFVKISFFLRNHMKLSLNSFT